MTSILDIFDEGITRKEMHQITKAVEEEREAQPWTPPPPPPEVIVGIALLRNLYTCQNCGNQWKSADPTPLVHRVREGKTILTPKGAEMVLAKHLDHWCSEPLPTNWRDYPREFKDSCIERPICHACFMQVDLSISAPIKAIPLDTPDWRDSAEDREECDSQAESPEQASKPESGDDTSTRESSTQETAGSVGEVRPSALDAF